MQYSSLFPPFLLLCPHFPSFLSLYSSFPIPGTPVSSLYSPFPLFSFLLFPLTDHSPQRTSCIFPFFLFLPMIVRLPSPNLVWNTGASAMASHLYVPEDRKPRFLSITDPALLRAIWWGKKERCKVGVWVMVWALMSTTKENMDLLCESWRGFLILKNKKI